METTISSKPLLLHTSLLPSGIFVVQVAANQGVYKSIPTIVVFLFFNVIYLMCAVGHLSESITSKRFIMIGLQVLGAFFLIIAGLSSISSCFTFESVTLPTLIDYDEPLSLLFVTLLLCLSSGLSFSYWQANYRNFSKKRSEGLLSILYYMVSRIIFLLLITYLLSFLGRQLHHSFRSTYINLLSIVLGTIYIALGIVNINIIPSSE